MATTRHRAYRGLKIARLTTRWRERQARAREPDPALEASLKSLGFWNQ